MSQGSGRISSRRGGVVRQSPDTTPRAALTIFYAAFPVLSHPRKKIYEPYGKRKLKKKNYFFYNEVNPTRLKSSLDESSRKRPRTTTRSDTTRAL